MKKYNVAILGATGAVGGEFLKLIEERNFPFAELRLLASKRSAGKQIDFMGKTYTACRLKKEFRSCVRLPRRKYIFCQEVRRQI